jgi:hypothetical protein
VIVKLFRCCGTFKILVSSHICRRASTGAHCCCRALDDHVEFSSLPKLELLIVTSCLSLFSDGMHEALETIVTWMKFIQFSFLFDFIICSFLLSSVFSIQFCTVVSTALHFHFSPLAVFCLLYLFLIFRNHCRVFDLFPCFVLLLPHVSSCVWHTILLGQFSTATWIIYAGLTIAQWQHSIMDHLHWFASVRHWWPNECIEYPAVVDRDLKYDEREGVIGRPVGNEVPNGSHDCFMLFAIRPSVDL